jgi:uncharacterized protein (TIGR00369 family)
MKVIRKQKNSHWCIICGMDNPAGVKAPFYEMEDHSVVSIFHYSPIHQSFPERTHGGLITTMLDEIIGRAIWIDEPTTYGVTMDIQVKFRHPVPYDEEILAQGRIIKNSKKFFVGTGEIYDKNHQVLASATATYIKLPPEKIVEDTNMHEAVNVEIEDQVKEINI